MRCQGYTFFLPIFTTFALLLSSGLPDLKAGSAQTSVVTSAEDGEPGSLRQVINDAIPGSKITFSSSLRDMIYIRDHILVNKNLIIEGPGAGKLAISAAGLDSIFVIAARVNISGLILEDGKPDIGISGTDGGAIWNGGILTLTDVFFRDNATEKLGGAIYNRKDGTLYIRNCTFLRNRNLRSIGAGGALANEGVAVIVNSTFYRNSSLMIGGAIYNAGGKLDLVHSTIWGNIAGREGGGMKNEKGKVTLQGTIVAGNRNEAYEEADDISGRVVSLGYNLVQSRSQSSGYTALDFPDGVDPMLDTSDPIFNAFDEVDPGANRFVKVVPLQVASPMIDAIPSRHCRVKTDQLNTPRPQGKGCDIGAFEFKGTGDTASQE
jgi:hypothetical protein